MTAASLFLYQVLSNLAPDAAGLDMWAYLIGGQFGIIAAMAVFRWWRARRT